MKHTILLLFFLILTINGFSIQKIQYAYDLAGNRILRKCIEVTLPQAPAPRAQKPDTIAIENQVDKPQIIVYPNPTKGALAVEITNCSPDQKLAMKLYSPSGVLLKNLPTIEGKNTIDMTDYPAGWFMLRVFVGENPVEIKIIKE